MEQAALPSADDGEAGIGAEAAVAEGLADERGAGGGSLGNEKGAKLGDDVGAAGGALDTTGEEAAEELVETEDLGGAGEGEDFDGGEFLSEGDDRNDRGDAAGGKGGVGVRDIGVGRGDEDGVFGAGVEVGVGVIGAAEEDFDAGVVEAQGFLGIGDEDEVGETVGVETLDDGFDDRIVVGKNNVAGEVERGLAGGAGGGLGGGPRGVEKLDESEGQEDEEEDEAGEEDDDGEGAAEHTGESNVAEAEGRHHSECPIDTVEEMIFVAALVGHDQVEEDAVNDDQEAENGEELGEKADVTSLWGGLTDDRTEGDGHEFHGGRFGRGEGAGQSRMTLVPPGRE